ncbi:sensor histidine kinase [Desulfosarcina widdelii]|uniref:histidine kinase n=1 Tax=Desulfosarcina widdelii TaxID=947919 RepID=A0A5K7Z494_9BACT|nr:sensor histidine kinase [Desulfosarcina widdelii]BBO76576.1 sensor histidine kinase [Desulfosarcina widdelii]
MENASLVKRQQKRAWIIAVVAVLILIAATGVHFLFGRRMIALVSDQFNQEQLTVARSIRKLVETSLNTLEKELLNLAGSVSAAQSDPVDLLAGLRPELEIISRPGVEEIRLWDRKNQTMGVFSHGNLFAESAAAFPDIDSLPLPESGEVRLTRPCTAGSRVYLYLIAPLGSVGDQYLIFRLNLTWFLSPLLTGVRSGASGYAWVIDGSGYFLYHPYMDFIGHSAFDIRRETYPDLSFFKIDRIQKEEMLQGREGTGTYESAWHRGLAGKMSKLIAYCPIHVSQEPKQFWSVAVVAPIHEIASAIGQVQRWQLVLQGVTILVVGAAAAALLLFEVRFSRRLEKLVDARTRALKRSEERYRLLIESAEDFIFTLNAAICLKSVNSFTANFFGSDAEQLIDRPLADLLDEDVARKNTKAIRQVFDSGRSVREEIEIRSVDPPVWLNANYMPLKNETGEIHLVLCIARDITENKMLQRRLVTTEKLAALGTLAAGVAHEINNPLGVILGFCDLLVRKQEPGSQVYEDLRIIERQGLHCKQIVDNLLSFARDRKVSEKSADLNLCLVEILTVARHSIERRAVTVKTDIARRLPMVNGDCRQLQQVFLNLMNNAVDAMPEGGVLTISAAYDKGSRQVIVKVADNGCGIREDRMDRIYEPFYTTKPEGEGTGLGLFVIYGIVHGFGGSIHCESRVAEKPGEKSGTTFIVKLPQHPKEKS